MTAKSTKATLGENVSELIKNDITKHVLKPGEKINLKDLCTRYGVSETPVRTALTNLAADNLIEIFPRQGMIVKPINIDNCRETFELRRMMELYTADKMVETYAVDESFRKELEENVKQNMDAVKKLNPGSSYDDYQKNYRLDSDFHRTLLSCAGSEMLMNTYQSINPFQYINYVYEKQSKERLIKGIEEHTDVLNALKTGNVDLVREKLATHLDNAMNSIITILKRDDFINKK